MSSRPRFTRPCPTCGRNLDIPVAHIGRDVACSHCKAVFEARLDSHCSAGTIEEDLESRIDRLLAITAFARPDASLKSTHQISLNTYEV